MSTDLEKLDYAMYNAARGADTHKQQLVQINDDEDCKRLLAATVQERADIEKSVRLTRITRRDMRQQRSYSAQMQKALPGFTNNSTIRYPVDESGKLTHVFYEDHPAPWQIRAHVKNCFRLAEQDRIAAESLREESERIIAVMERLGCTFLEAMEYIANEESA